MGEILMSQNASFKPRELRGFKVICQYLFTEVLSIARSRRTQNEESYIENFGIFDAVDLF